MFLALTPGHEHQRYSGDHVCFGNRDPRTVICGSASGNTPFETRSGRASNLDRTCKLTCSN